MSLQVNQNIAAMSAHRWLEINDKSMSKSIERLSSGFRINSAADDAAGLVISENLRTQVSGLTQAGKNTQDGINMFKTGEKALDEIESQLRNIRDLTLHAASQNDNSSAKAADQAQINQAMDSINRIATQTEFAGMKLLGGTNGSESVDGKFFQIGANSGQQATFDVSSLSTFQGKTLTADMRTSSILAGAGAASLADAASGTAFDGTTGGTDAISMTWTHPDGTTTTADLSVAYAAAATADDMVTNINTALDGQAFTTAADPTVSKLSDVMEAYNNGGTIGLRLKDVYANQGEKTSASSLKVVSLNSVTAEGTQFGVPGVSDAGVSGGSTFDVENAATTGAYDALVSRVDDALTLVNGLRVNLGAFQKNNLESNLSSIAVSKENLAASESAIRDTDMADEMVSFTKAQILAQASQSMMSQANQSPQNILQMLR